MTEAFWIALLVGVGSPALLMVLTNLNKASERREDFARQDAVAAKVTEAAKSATEVAAKAAEAARLLQEQQTKLAHDTAERAKLLVASNQRVEDKTAETAKVTLAKLEGIAKQGDVIHTLVNSNMTAAMQSEYDAITRELAQMGEIIALKRAAGQEPSAEALGAVTSTKEKIAELRVVLDDRQKQAKVVEKQVEAQTK